MRSKTEVMVCKHEKDSWNRTDGYVLPKKCKIVKDVESYCTKFNLGKSCRKSDKSIRLLLASIQNDYPKIIVLENG